MPSNVQVMEVSVKNPWIDILFIYAVVKTLHKLGTLHHKPCTDESQ